MSRRRLERRQYLLLRLTAVLLDALVFSLALMIPGTLASVGALLGGADPSTTRTIWWVVAGVLVLGLLSRDSYRGRSPGKRVLGLILSTPGRKCGLFRSIIRNLPLLPFLPVEILLVLFRADSRRIGDMIARTQVIEE